MRSYADRDLAPITVQLVDPNDSDSSTAQTIALMQRYARAGAYHQPVIDATRAALARVPASAPAWRKAQAIAEWVSRKIRFKTDESILENGLGLSPEQELLIPPYLLLRFRAGDCDDFAQLVCAMLLCAQIPCSLVTIAADPDTPWRFSHVYAVAYLEDGSRLPVDTAAAAQGRGKPVGWEAPFAFRRQEWPVS